MTRTWILVLVIAVVAASCGTQDVAMRTPAPIAKLPPSAESDWSNVEVVTLVLDEYAFRPEELVLEKERRYRLHLTNAGSKTHSFASAAFFRAIAMRSVAGGEAYHTTAIELRPGEQRELAFVPLKPGIYPFECNVFLHDIFGMTGQITIR